VECAREVNLPLAPAEAVTESAGLGVRALVDGAEVRVGRWRWLTDAGAAPASGPLPAPADTDGLSLLHVARNGVILGAIGLRDQIRSEARESLEALRRAGVRRLVMVTGDREAVAQRVGRETGCDEVRAECLPADKVAAVQQLKARGWRVAVVGDGVNDAPALAAGDLGIAMGAAGSDVAIHSASIALMNNDLRRLPFLVELSRATRRTINQNFLIGLAFIVGGLTLAALGYINPIVAAILHNAGSLLVVFNSARLVRSGEGIEPAPAGAAAALVIERTPLLAAQPS
jgi:Cd2+/Zn2+-exporting ATPase